MLARVAYTNVVVVFVLALSPLYLNSTDAAEKGLVVYWPLDGDAKDASGNGHDGVIQGAKWVDGVEGKAAEFDGIAA